MTDTLYNYKANSWNRISFLHYGHNGNNYGNNVL